MSIVYLNGEFMPKGEASISVDDRGFLLSDGVYEVTPFYGGVGFCLDRHLVRLERSLRELGILFDTEGLTEVHHRLVAENRLDCLLYTSPSPRDGLLSRMPSSA